MPWTVLLLAVGSLASPIPAPSIVLAPPHPSSQDDSIHIACTAPFLGANFTLYREEEVLQLLQAPEDQREVTFTVTAGAYGETAGRDFRCQYSVMGEHGQPQLSELSQPLQVSFPGATWILALSLGMAGVFLLLTGLVAIALVVRKVKSKKLQKQREKESCWAQINFTSTDLSFDNSLFVLSTKMTPGDNPTATLDPPSCNSEPRKRPTSSSSSSEPCEFSTFRPCLGD